MFDDLHPLSCDGLMLHGFFDDRYDPSAELKSIIVALAHEFCFDYEFALHLKRTRDTVGCRPLAPLSRLEFLELLEFREDEIRRVMSGGDPSWCWPDTWKPSWGSHITSSVGSDLDHALQQTQHAQTVQKTLLGHGSRVSLDHPVNMRIGTLIGILLDSPHFTPIPEPPLVLSSYDRPPPVSSEHRWDFETILGEYRRPYKIFLHVRALTACSESLGIERRLLQAIVILHECAHYFAAELPTAGASPFRDRPGLPPRNSWIDSGYAGTAVEVHETIAQLLTFWACQDSWLRDTFEKLNGAQSYPYRRFKDDLESGASPLTVVAAIAQVRSLKSGADLRAWKDALGTYP